MSQVLKDRYATIFTAKVQPCISQDQGTCGLVSFWFAAMLRSNGATTIPYPRKRNRSHDKIVARSATSLREYAKANLGSAQGEVLSAKEMETLVDAHGFTGIVAPQDYTDEQKKGFIRIAFGLDSPVLIAYWATQTPANRIEPATVGGLGAHWSLIIGEDGSDYVYVEPNNPYWLQKCDKDKFLDSNRVVGKQPLAREWIKTARRDEKKGTGPNVMPMTTANAGSAVATYDLYKGGRKYDLENALVSVV